MYLIAGPFTKKSRNFGLMYHIEWPFLYVIAGSFLYLIDAPCFWIPFVFCYKIDKDVGNGRLLREQRAAGAMLTGAHKQCMKTVGPLKTKSQAISVKYYTMRFDYQMRFFALLALVTLASAISPAEFFSNKPSKIHRKGSYRLILFHL